MDIAFSCAVYAVSMAACLLTGASTSWAIVAAVVLFFLCGLRRKYGLQALLKMGYSNLPASFTVIRILVILGALTGLWRSCGTIPFCIYYGIRFIRPGMFIFVTFLINVLLSLALGTSLGVASTSGVVLISLARFGGVDPLICAGAVMSGIYFGDRTAPTSSCANLVAAITGTKLYDDIKYMTRSALLPYGASLVFYAVLSWLNPIGTVDETMMNALCTEFQLSFWTVIPAAIMIVLPLLRCPLFLSMGASGLCAALVSMFVQHMSLSDVLKIAVFGYAPEGGMLAQVITGGGITSIGMSIVMVTAAGIFTGLLQGMGILNGIQARLKSLSQRIGRIKVSNLIGLVCPMIFCNQTTSNIVHSQLMKEIYPDGPEGRLELACDINNTSVLWAGLIPWSVACSIPLDCLEAGIGALPYAFLLYAIPVCYLFTKKRIFKGEHL